MAQVRVFVSHHHSPEEDRFTTRLVADLESAGADVWVDDQRITSDDFIKKINEGLAGRQWLVLVMTPDAIRSPWVQAEVNAALNQMRKGRMLGVIPIVAKPCDHVEIPPLLDALHRYDATQEYESARGKLLHAMGLTFASPAPHAESAHPDATDAMGPAPVSLRPAKSPSHLDQSNLHGTTPHRPDKDGFTFKRKASIVPDVSRYLPHLRRLSAVYLAAGATVLSLTVIVTLMVHFVGSPVGGSSSSSAAAQTATAQIWLTHGPTARYGPVAPGSACDKGPGASQWIAVLENGNVTCAGGNANVVGPAALSFGGAGGFVFGSRFSIMVNAFTAASKSDCLDFSVGLAYGNIYYNSGHQVSGHIDEQVCQSGVVTTSFYDWGGSVSQQTSTTVVSFDRPVTLAIMVSSTTWNMLINGVSVTNPSMDTTFGSPSDISEVKIRVDTGAQVTLARFTVSPE